MKHTTFNTLTDDELIAHGQITDVQGYTLELLQRYEKLVGERDDRIKELMDDIEAKDAEIHELSSTISELDDELAELHELRSTISELENELAELHELRSTISELENELAELRLVQNNA